MALAKVRFRCAAAVLLVLVLASVVGCSSGPKFTGWNGPTPAAGAPVVTSLSPSSVMAGGPAFTLTVTGKNFASNMTVGVTCPVCLSQP